MASGKRPSAMDPTHEDNWHVSYYELAIKLGPADDTRLDAALKAMWEAARLGEPFRRGSREDVAVTAAALRNGHLNTVATIPGLGSTLASVIVVREEVDDAGRAVLGNDWLDLCLPLGALGNLDDRVGAYPFNEGSDSRSWREPIEQWFAAIGLAVFAAVPFVHAITGEEVSGIEPSEDLKGRVRSPAPQHRPRLERRSRPLLVVVKTGPFKSGGHRPPATYPDSRALPPGHVA